MKDQSKTEVNISRRHLLARVGLAAGAAYMAPVMMGLNAARASGASGGNSGASGGNSGASGGNSGASRGGSGPSRGSSGPSRSSSGPSRARGRSGVSRGSSRPGANRGQNAQAPRWLREMLGQR